MSKRPRPSTTTAMQPAAAAPPTPRPFTILTYNVLADHLCRPHWFPYRSKAELDFEKSRWPTLRAALDEEDADVVCLQELQCVVGPPHVQGQDHHVDVFDKHLRGRGYSGMFQARMTAQATQVSFGPQVGNGIYWKCSRFEPIIVDKSVGILRIIHEACGSDKKLRASFAGSDMRGTVACFAALRCRVTGQVLVMATTHLPAPRNDEDAQSKMEQLVHAFALVHALAQFCEKVVASAVVIAGDLNSKPGSSVYELLERGFLSPHHVADVARAGGHRRLPFMNEQGALVCPPLKLLSTATTEQQQQHQQQRSCYMQSVMKTSLGGVEPAFTNLTNSFKGCLDYVFLAGDPHVVRIPPSERHDPSALVKETSFLPDPVNGHGSDHIPIKCELEFVVPTAREQAIHHHGPLLPGGEAHQHDVPPPWMDLSFQSHLVGSVADLDAMLDHEAFVQARALVMTCQGVGSTGRECAMTVMTLKPMLNVDLGDRTFVNASPAFVIDLAILGRDVVFGHRGGALKALLESRDILKVCHNVRFDSDALWHQFGVRVDGVRDTSLWHEACCQVDPALMARIQRGSGRGGAPLSLVAIVPVYVHPIDQRALRFEAPHRNDRAAWSKRPLVRNMQDFASAQAHLVELVARSMTSKAVPEPVMELVMTRSSALVDVVRGRPQALVFPLRSGNGDAEVKGRFSLVVPSSPPQ